MRFKLTSGYDGTGEFNVKDSTITGFVGGNGVTLQRPHDGCTTVTAGAHPRSLRASDSARAAVAS